jgi:hypothetical protein
MKNILNINNPVKNAIIVYLIFIGIYILFFQEKYQDEKPYLLPILVITLSVVSYFFFIFLKYVFS